MTRNFVADHQASVGQLQWDADLGGSYADPGDVSDVRWCTGTLISHNLFLTAGHCFDQNPSRWRVPRIDGTDDPIPPEEIASRMHVNFNYQVDPDGNLRTEVGFDIDALVEYRLGGLDFAIVRLVGTPGASFGIGKDRDLGCRRRRHVGHHRPYSSHLLARDRRQRSRTPEGQSPEQELTRAPADDDGNSGFLRPGDVVTTGVALDREHRHTEVAQQQRQPQPDLAETTTTTCSLRGTTREPTRAVRRRSSSRLISPAVKIAVKPRAANGR